ncbi:MAG: hypothetical protein LHW59_05335 [Candidatus Cloacimonetes bacterium]|nr:hypothetical protein [Candidatus Cloacimonadota bacterium]
MLKLITKATIVEIKRLGKKINIITENIITSPSIPNTIDKINGFCSKAYLILATSKRDKYFTEGDFVYEPQSMRKRNTLWKN